MIRKLIFLTIYSFFSFTYADTVRNDILDFNIFKLEFQKSRPIFCSYINNEDCIPDNTSFELMSKKSRFKGTCINGYDKAFELYLEIYPKNTMTLEGSIKNINLEINYAYTEYELNNKSIAVDTSYKLPSFVEPLLPDFHVSSKNNYSPIYTGDGYFMFEVLNELIYGKAIVRESNSGKLFIKMTVPDSEVASDYVAYCSLTGIN